MEVFACMVNRPFPFWWNYKKKRGGLFFLITTRSDPTLLPDKSSRFENENKNVFHHRRKRRINKARLKVSRKGWLPGGSRTWEATARCHRHHKLPRFNLSSLPKELIQVKKIKNEITCARSVIMFSSFQNKFFVIMTMSIRIFFYSG